MVLCSDHALPAGLLKTLADFLVLLKRCICGPANTGFDMQQVAKFLAGEWARVQAAKGVNAAAGGEGGQGLSRSHIHSWIMTWTSIWQWERRT